MTAAYLETLSNEDYYEMTGLFRTRYQATKHKKESRWCDGTEIIVKVDGGYKLMDYSTYRLFRHGMSIYN